MSTEQQENITRVFDGPIGVPDLGLLARLVAYEDGNLAYRFVSRRTQELTGEL